MIIPFPYCPMLPQSIADLIDTSQKNEIERQVAAMLKASTIVRGLSPFSSPILLVKKKDNSWRFCIEYKKLNTITVKNKFPLSIID
jgi:hypothetical protein